MKINLCVMLYITLYIYVNTIYLYILYIKMLAQMKSEWNDVDDQSPSAMTMDMVIPHKDTADNGADNTTHDIVKNYAFKLKLFSIQKKRDKSELKDEKEASRRLLYKCPYCDKLYSNVTRFEVHRRTHVSSTLCNVIIHYRPERNHSVAVTAANGSTRKAT